MKDKTYENQIIGLEHSDPVHLVDFLPKVGNTDILQIQGFENFWNEQMEIETIN